jgi:hypothetical protein
MIWNGIITFILGIFTYLVTFLPSVDSTVTVFITSSLSTVRTWLTALNFVIDIPTLGYMLGTAILIEFVILGFHVVQWVIANLSVGFYHPTK